MIEHEFNGYRKNFADNTMTANCRCGWKASIEDYAEGARLFKEHIAPSPVQQPKFAVISGPTQEDKDAAVYFRELADRIDAGDIANIIVAFNDKAGNHFERYGNWRDRWQMLGAIEYAKFAVDRPE